MTLDLTLREETGSGYDLREQMDPDPICDFVKQDPIYDFKKLDLDPICDLKKLIAKKNYCMSKKSLLILYRNVLYKWVKTSWTYRRNITECFIYYRKSILQSTQPSRYRCTQLHCRFAVISEAPSSSQYDADMWRKNRYFDLFKAFATVIKLQIMF